jgi:acyl carrier protein
MGRTEFLGQLAEILEVDSVDENFDLNGKWDSLVVLSAIAAIDEQYGVTVEVRQLVETKSVGEVLALIERSGGRTE